MKQYRIPRTSKERNKTNRRDIQGDPKLIQRKSRIVPKRVPKKTNERLRGNTKMKENSKSIQGECQRKSKRSRKEIPRAPEGNPIEIQSNAKDRQQKPKINSGESIKSGRGKSQETPNEISRKFDRIETDQRTSEAVPKQL